MRQQNLQLTATFGAQWQMINPPNMYRAYVDEHQRTHKAETLALREIGGLCSANQGRRPIARISPEPNILFDSNTWQAFKMIVKEVARFSGQERPCRWNCPHTMAKTTCI